jgi:hypothetical protein
MGWYFSHSETMTKTTIARTQRSSLDGVAVSPQFGALRRATVLTGDETGVVPGECSVLNYVDLTE